MEIKGRYPIYILQEDTLPQSDQKGYVVGLQRDEDTFIPQTFCLDLAKASALCSIRNAELVLEMFTTKMRPLIDPVIKHAAYEDFLVNIRTQKSMWNEDPSNSGV